MQPKAYPSRATVERALLLCRTASDACTGCSATCSGLVRARPAVSQCLLWACKAYRSLHTQCAGDCIHLFHVVTHDTARSLECFSRPMEEDLPPEYHQEMLVRI